MDVTDQPTSHAPEGDHSVTPWIISRDTDGVIAFLTEAFDAVELDRMTDEHGTVGHAEVRIGDSKVLLFDKPDWPPTPAFLRLYVHDAAVAHDRAVAAGGRSVTRPTPTPWGDVTCRVQDRFGNLYWVNHRAENLTEHEMARRFAEPEYLRHMAYIQAAQFHPSGP